MYEVRAGGYKPLAPLPGGLTYSSQMIGGAVTMSPGTIFRPTGSY